MDIQVNMLPEYFAFKYLVVTEKPGSGYLIGIIAAVVIGLSTTVKFRMQRATYFLSGAILLFGATTARTILKVSVAIMGSWDLILISVLDILILIVVAYFCVLINKARSNDAHGHSGYAWLGFIPIVNLWLLFVPPKDQNFIPLPKIMRGVTAVILGLIILVASAVVYMEIMRFAFPH